MPSHALPIIRVEKPWGRTKLWPGFADPPENGPAIGEIWFDAPNGRHADLLVKYLFTSERLSIQVHPDDATAQAAGYPHGKEEAWIILAAEPDSTIALGTVRPVSRAELRSAALDGSIESLMDWKPVKAGDVFYSPAGTVHAIGAGITLVEVQQNLDLTYRLYDYGRPRELHLDQGIAVSNPVPFEISPAAKHENERAILFEGKKFVTERWTWQGAKTITLPPALPGWFSPLTGNGTIDGQPWTSGECWIVEDSAAIVAGTGADMLFSYMGDTVLPVIGAD